MNAFRRGRLHFVYRSKTKQAAVGLYRILLFQIRPEPEPDLDLGSCFGSQNNTPDETNGINKWQQCCLLLQRGSTVQWFFWYHTVSWTKLWNINRFCIFTLRRYALYGLSYRNSVRLSVTLVHCVHMVQPTIMMVPKSTTLVDPEMTLTAIMHSVAFTHVFWSQPLKFAWR